MPFERERELVFVEFRNYGLWSPERAAQYGYDFPRPKIAEMTEAEMLAYEECSAELSVTLKTFRGDHDPFSNPSLADRLDGEAYNAAQANQEWEAARDRWRSCIAERGLTPNGDSWVSKQGAEIAAAATEEGVPPEVKAEEIRVAVIEAECNRSTNLTQTLANLEASYQVPLIRKNEAALQQEKEDIASRVATAEKFIQENQ